MRRQLTPRSPIRIASLGRSSNPARMTKNLSRKCLIVISLRLHFPANLRWGYFSGYRTDVRANTHGRYPQMSKTDTAITTVGYNSFLYCSLQCKGVLRFSLVGSVDPSALQGNFRRRPSTDLSALIKRISTMHVHGRSSLLTPDMVPYPRSFLRLPAAATP